MDERVRYIRKIERNYEMISKKASSGEALNQTELLAIHFIRHHNGITQERLSNLIGCDKALTTRMVKKLLELQLIERKDDLEDRRKKHLYPTPKAEELKASVVAEEEEYYEEVLSVLDDKEREDFLTLLTKVYLKSKSMRKEVIKK